MAAALISSSLFSHRKDARWSLIHWAICGLDGPGWHSISIRRISLRSQAPATTLRTPLKIHTSRTGQVDPIRHIAAWFIKPKWQCVVICTGTLYLLALLPRYRIRLPSERQGGSWWLDLTLCAECTVDRLRCASCRGWLQCG